MAIIRLRNHFCRSAALRVSATQTYRAQLLHLRQQTSVAQPSSSTHVSSAGPAHLLSNKVCSGKWLPDSGQAHAAILLQQLHDSPSSLGGVYLWGSVGSGKTALMNLLVQSAGDSARRWHFHELMQHVSHRPKQAAHLTCPCAWTDRRIHCTVHRRTRSFSARKTCRTLARLSGAPAH